MKLVIWESLEDRARGLQFMPAIDPETLYVFMPALEGETFHSRNVAEPFDIAFLDENFVALEISRVVPEEGTATAPAGTLLAVEAKAGTLAGMCAAPGRRVF